MPRVAETVEELHESKAAHDDEEHSFELVFGSRAVFRTWRWKRVKEGTWPELRVFKPNVQHPYLTTRPIPFG